MFYDRQTGAPRTVADIYRSFAQRIETAAQSLAGTIDSAGAASTGTRTKAATSPSTVTGGPVNRPAAFLRRLGLGAGPLSGPVLSMFNVLALSALKLIHGSRGTGSSADPALQASTHVAATGDRRRELTDI